MTGLKSLKLLYRASNDGLSAVNFHSNVDYKSNNTILIVKIQNIDCYLGGITSVAWDSTSGYKSDSNAYLFSMRRVVGSNSSCLKRIMIKDSSKAIYCNQ